MRNLATALSTILAFGTLVVTDAAPCRADAGTHAATPAAATGLEVTAAPQLGTEEEEHAYASREADSPAAQEFNGGFILTLLIILVIVVVIILIVQ